MCGIWCAFSNNNTCAELIKSYKQNFEENIKRRGPNYHETQTVQANQCNIVFTASVLWLQGLQLTKQPVVSEKSVFLFNGDIFEGGDDADRRINGDTKMVHQLLDEASNIIDGMTELKGPYAFIYLDKTNNKLYLGRDPFGRRSLLVGTNTLLEGFILTSVASKTTGYDFIEIPAVGIFTIDLNNNAMELFSWGNRHDNFMDNISLMENFTGISIKVHDSVITNESFKYIDPLETDLHTLVSIHQLESNLAFKSILENDVWHDNVMHLYELLRNAVQRRMQNQPDRCQDCINLELDTNCTHSAIGVLFSGGLDCSVLALLAEEYTNAANSIDLINVSFDEKTGFNSPDRITAEVSFKELMALRPNRIWNLVKVNVAVEELNNWRSKQITDLIYPLDTILDDSLGCALWFASRGQSNDYKCPSRVLIVGMGADELFGGYTKHRRSFKEAGWRGLNDSLNLDWQNISVRNLARDDRVVSDHGRQLRTPYLDENVVDLLRNLDIWKKTYLNENVSQGIGDKILLRSLAYHLGFRQVAGFKKRALQFGSRIAKSKENAYHSSPRL